MAKRQKTTRFSIQAYDNAHYRTTEQYARAVDALFDVATREISQAATRGKIDPEKPFSFDDYPKIKGVMQDVTTQLADRLTTTIETGSKKQWLFACKKNDGFIASIMDTSRLSKARLNKMQDRNLDALQAFQGRKVEGMNLSERVWKYVGQYREQMETALDAGLGEGRSAQQLARDVKQNLKDPNRLFRRVRDKRGNLVLSKAARAFHPGRGVYRSSVKNAQRLTRSEINMAYRESDWQRWQSLDFVVGYEVVRSNHEPLCDCDICARLVGRYPKTFKFIGWHPQCMCYAIPILMDEETFDDNELGDLKAALRGTTYKHKQAANTVTDVPDSFKEWVKDHIEAQKKWASTPYFIRDNFKNGDLSKGLKIALPTIQQVDVLAAYRSQIEEARANATKWGLSVQLNMLELRVTNKDIAGLQSTLATIKSKTAQMEKMDAKKPQSSVSRLMPDELKTKSAYLNGEDYTFAKDFFDLIDPNKPIRLEILDSDTGSYSSFIGDLVHIAGKKRGKLSPWECKAVIYHEYGHCIDAQRDLWKDPKLIAMRDAQIKKLKKKGEYTLYERKWNHESGGWYYERTKQTITMVEYIDKRLIALSEKISWMNDDVFAKRGITKHDVLEQIGSTRDTIKSLVVKYGFGHSTAYFRKIRMKETEYLAHAFENAFLGNRVFQKYLPDIYAEMVAYIRALKPITNK